jgi:hypothetical protein
MLLGLKYSGASPGRRVGQDQFFAESAFYYVFQDFCSSYSTAASQVPLRVRAICVG